MITLDKSIFDESQRIWKKNHLNAGLYDHFINYVIRKEVNLESFGKSFPFIIRPHKTNQQYTHRVPVIYSLQYLYTGLKRWLKEIQTKQVTRDYNSEYINYFFTLENKEEIFTSIVEQLEKLLLLIKQQIGPYFITVGYSI